MSQQPFSAAALRGAVDLSRLGGGNGRPGAPASAPGAPGQAAGTAPGAAGAATGQGQDGVPGRSGALVHADDASFEAVVNASLTTPLVLVLWTPQVPESVQHLRELAQAVRGKEGRFQVVGIDLAAAPGVMQALTPVLQQTFGQITALPVVLGLMGGQPMPFYLGVQEMSQVDQLLDQFLQAAVTNGVTGRVELADADAPGGEDEDAEPELPPLHQAAYEAIERGDWTAAQQAYEQALQQDAGDEQARLGLAQVRLLERTSRMDLTAVRQAAADRPTDVQAQLDAADVDVVGGHVEDAFVRLVDLVRTTAGDDRDRVRTHLLGLFDVVGTHDPRVGKARSALMSALF